MRKKVWRALQRGDRGTHADKRFKNVDRRADKAEFDGPQWLRRYLDRYGSA